ncbi:Left-right determination factor 2 [Heterocephalus glaber]|uniref:Left-right determination factor 2 n=1 Tax=Heterocephalus glaber TaxID=10181 RepID=G5BAP4_HETGA|nr:Left-right determination factor 2 [Heterocephalus glaber]
MAFEDNLGVISLAPPTPTSDKAQGFLSTNSEGGWYVWSSSTEELSGTEGYGSLFPVNVTLLHLLGQQVPAEPLQALRSHCELPGPRAPGGGSGRVMAFEDNLGVISLAPPTPTSDKAQGFLSTNSEGGWYVWSSSTEELSGTEGYGSLFPVNVTLLHLLRLVGSAMQLLWLCWVLWVLPLASPGAALTEDQVLGNLLQQLGLRQAPVLDKAEVQGLSIPAHVRAEYVALLQRSHGDRSRGKRFSQNFRGLSWMEGVSGYAWPTVQNRLLLRGRAWNWTPGVLPGEGLGEVHAGGSGRGPVSGGRLKAATFSCSGARAARLTLLVSAEVAGRFLASEASTHLLGAQAQGEPQLELHTLDLRDSGAQGNCDPEAGVARCCRQETYLDLQGMKWAENWVLEPPGFLAYECVGSCLQPPEHLTFTWPFVGPRQCIASETAALPMIVSIKEGGRTRSQVVSLPNMRVQRCSCAWDGAPVPRVLEP